MLKSISFACEYPVFLGFPGGTSNKEPLANSEIRDMGSIPGLGRSPGGGHGNPLQYSCLENPMDREAWWATIYRVPESQTWLKWRSMQASRFSSIICKKAVLFPLNCLGTLVKNHLTTYANSLFLDFLFYSICVCIYVCVCLFLCKYHTVYGQLLFDKYAKTVQWRNNSTFNKWYWDNWVSTYKRMRLDSYSHHIQYSTQTD